MPELIFFVRYIVKQNKPAIAFEACRKIMIVHSDGVWKISLSRY